MFSVVNATNATLTVLIVPNILQFGFNDHDCLMNVHMT